MLAGAIAGLLVSCRSVDPNGDPSALGDSRSHVVRLLELVESPEFEGRETGLRGGVRTASWVAGLMGGAHLQPFMEGEYRWMYPLQKHVLGEVDVRLVSPDTIRFVHGIAYLVDRHSAEGTMTQRLAGGPYVRSERLVLDSTAIRPGPYTGSGSAMRMMWLPSALRRLPLGSSTASVRIQMELEERVLSGFVVGGFLPGTHPLKRDSLRVVIARMDGQGLQGASAWTDGSDSGVGLVSMLAAMEEASRRQDMKRSYRGSTLFLAVSGIEEGCQGAKWVQEHLPWDRNHIQAVLLVGMGTSCFGDWNPEVVGSDADLFAPLLIRRNELLSDARLETALDAAMNWKDTVLTWLEDTP